MSHDASYERPHSHPELQVGGEPRPSPEPERAGGRDLLGVALAVYFVALIGIVAVMLVLSALAPRP